MSENLKVNSQTSNDITVSITDIVNLSTIQLQRKSKDYLSTAVDTLIKHQQLNPTINDTHEDMVSVNNFDRIMQNFESLKLHVSSDIEVINHKLDDFIKDLTTLSHNYDKLSQGVTNNTNDITNCNKKIEELELTIITIQSKISHMNNIDVIPNINVPIDNFSNNTVHQATNILNSSKVTYIDKNEDYKYRIKITGLPEINCNNFNSRCDSELKEVNDILVYLQLSDLKVADLRRVGKFVSINKQRPLLVKFTSIWDVRKIISKVKLLKNYHKHKIFVTPDLSLSDREKEKAVLKARYILLTQRVDKSKLKIWNLKLFNDNIEVKCDQL